MRKNKSGNYFFLQPHCFVEVGKSGAAIYDLYRKKIYSIDLVIGKILCRFEKEKCSIHIATRKFTIKEQEQIINELRKIQSLNLGNFYNNITIIDKLIPELNKEIEISTVPSINRIWLETVTECNLNCLHCDETEARCGCTCFNNSRYELKIRQLNIRKWNKIFDDLLSWNIQEINFIGGEPLLEIDDLMKMISYIRSISASDMNPKMIVHTNLTLLDQKNISYFYDNNIAINAKIFSDKKHIHDNITKRDGSWKILVKNLKKLRKMGIKLSANIEIMKYNQNDIESTINFIRQLGINEISLSTLMTTKPELFPDKYSHRILKNFNSLCGVSYSQYFRNKQGNSCWDGSLAIKLNGNILPCIMAKNFIIGNIWEDDLINIIREKRFKIYWDLTKNKIESCKECEFKYCCSDCRPRESSHSDLFSKNRFCTIY